MPFNTLPGEIKVTIFDFFYNSIDTLGTICLVCYDWRAWAQYSHLWQLALNGRKVRKDAYFFVISLVGHLKYNVPLITPFNYWDRESLNKAKRESVFIWNEPLLCIIFNPNINTQQILMYLKKFIAYIRYKMLRNLSMVLWFHAACAGGRPELAQFFMQKNSSITKPYILSRNNLVLRISSAYGQLKTMRWLYESGYITRERIVKMEIPAVNQVYSLNVINQAYGNLVMKAASRYGNVELAIWGQKTFNFHREEGISAAISNSCTHGHLAMVKWLRSKFTFYNIERFKNDKEAIMAASAFGQLDMLQWLISNCHLTEGNKKQMALNALCKACKGGHLSTAQLIHNSWKEFITQFGFIHKNLLIRCCEKGHLFVVEWLINTFAITKEQIVGNDNRAFIGSCSSGHLAVCKFLHRIYDFTPQEAMLLNNKAFIFACEYNKNYIAQWLQSTFHISVENNTKLFNDLLFRACKEGDLIMAKWLVQLANHKYYTEYTIKKSLSYAKQKKHEHIIQWLKERFV